MLRETTSQGRCHGGVRFLVTGCGCGWCVCLLLLSVCVCVCLLLQYLLQSYSCLLFITAVPNTNLSAWGKEVVEWALTGFFEGNF